MRRLQMISGLLLAVLVAVAMAGCGGGGGGGGDDPTDYGTVNVTSDNVVYTPSAQVASKVTLVSADFINSADSSKNIAHVPFHIVGTSNNWQLDITSDSTDFPAAADGTYRMKVYATINDTTAHDELISERDITLHIGGDGGINPPPPPWP